MDKQTTRGPLAALKVIEFASPAPGPFGCMMLADLGADVLRIDRVESGPDGARPAPPVVPTDVLERGRRSVALNLKLPEAVEVVHRLIPKADVLVEGFRPGVMERLGFGPEPCLRLNPRLVYGRMTGWGQHGPLAQHAGHDINYIALAGALHLIGRPDGKPVPPANLLGDFAGGGMLLAFGILAALYERERSGVGQVLDVAMVDGSTLLTTMIHGLLAVGEWVDQRGVNILDGAAPFYDTYETADGGHVAVGAMEPSFYAELIGRLGIDVDLSRQNDTSTWATTKAKLDVVFRTRTRDEWCELFEGTDACVVPVLSLEEAAQHPHNKARDAFVRVGHVLQPAPAPRFGRSAVGTPAPPPSPGWPGPQALVDWGVPSETVDAAVAANALAAPAEDMIP